MLYTKRNKSNKKADWQEGRRDVAEEKVLEQEWNQDQNMDGNAGQAEDETPSEAVNEEPAEERELTKEEAKAARKKAKAEKKDKSKEKIAELEDRVKRQMAEFENFRKRTDKEKAQMFEAGAKSVIENILPVVDNFERGLQAAGDGGETDSFMEGMQMIYKQLMTELEGIGVKPIETIGTEFDPEFHNAVMQVESDEYETGIIAQELQKGYMYRDSVVRHSMVAVVQ